MITFQQQETTEIKNRIRAAWATFHMYRQELTSSSPTVRRSNNTDDMLRIWNMGTHQRARKSDTIGATQNARLIIQTKRRYKKIVKHKVKANEDLNNIDSSCTDDESEDGKSHVSHNDQDSDVSFESDNDEEIDAAEIEEDWAAPMKPWRRWKMRR